MTVPEEFRGYSPKEVAEITGGLYGEHELRRMAAHDEIAHHRGGRNKIVFFPDDIKALLRSTRRTPTKSRGQDTTPRTAPALAAVEAPADPFRSTPRSKAAHRARQSA